VRLYLPAVAPGRDSGIYRLLSDAQSVDNRPIARIANVAKIIQQTAATPDEREQTTPRMVVFLVELEVLGQIRDPVRQYGDLNFWGSGIVVVLPVLLDQIRFRFLQ
jgi:hypothetical protein